MHDYHLIPLAKALRERGHGNKIGFFIHVPFPPPEIVTALPNHDQLIPALCHYDLVGFQTEVDAANFSRYIANECGLPWANGNSFHFGNRVVQVGTFPVGVETEAFARLARRAVETAFVREVLDSLSGRAMIIGVDRLDYSKGIPERMNAFERFLTNFPGLARQGHVFADHAAQPHRHPGICRYRPAGGRGGRPHQRHLRRGVVDADALHQQGAQPHRARRALPRGARRAGDAAARRHESGGQGIRRGAKRRTIPAC